MWSIGNISYFPDQPHLDFSMNIDSEDGYPLEKWKKIEEAYTKRKIAEDPNFVYQKKTQNYKENMTGFIDYPDRPRRYRYRHLETDYIPPSKQKK